MKLKKKFTHSHLLSVDLSYTFSLFYVLAKECCFYSIGFPFTVLTKLSFPRAPPAGVKMYCIIFCTTHCLKNNPCCCTVIQRTLGQKGFRVQKGKKKGFNSNTLSCSCFTGQKHPCSCSWPGVFLLVCPSLSAEPERDEPSGRRRRGSNQRSCGRELFPRPRPWRIPWTTAHRHQSHAPQHGTGHHSPGIPGAVHLSFFLIMLRYVFFTESTFSLF